METQEVRTRRVIDPQKNRLYAAEKMLAQHSVLYPAVSDIQSYVDSVLNRKLVREEFDNRPIRVLDGRGRRSACATWEGEIKMPRWSRSTYVILHEVAHVLTNRHRKMAPRRWMQEDGQSLPFEITPHGPMFVGAYLLLVDEFMGVTAGDGFRAKLREHKVEWASWLRS